MGTADICLSYGATSRLFSKISCLHNKIVGYWEEIQPVHPKGNQSWIFIGRTDAEAETPILWPPDAKNWLIGKDPDAGKDWRRHKKGSTEGEMVGWHHRLNGHEFEQAPGAGDGQGSLVCLGSQRVRHDWVPELTEQIDLSLAQNFFLGWIFLPWKQRCGR